MAEKIFEAIEKYGMLKNTKKVIIGVSGGADSISLLHFFYKNFKNLKIIAVHVNHGLRGEESSRDENFVKDFCKNLDVNLKIFKKDIKNLAKIQKISLEESGRKARYEIFESLAQNVNAKIATAHTLSDNVETILLNLTRGTALKGLCGIPAVRGNIIRPLIFCTRDEIEAYCFENNLKYIIDSSNLNREFARNRIRLDVLPILKSINQNLENAILRASNALQEDELFLDNLAENALNEAKSENNFKKILNLPTSIKNRALKKLAEIFGAKNLAQKHLLFIEKSLKEGKNLTLPGKIEFKI